MIRQITLILSLVLFFGFIKSNGQAIITKSDSIPLGQDTIVKLVLPEYRGEVSWQQSIDKQNWITNNSNLSDTLEVNFDIEAYYRAKIKEGSCNPVFSDTIKINISDSLKEITSGAFDPPNFIFPNSEVVYFTTDTDTIVCRKVNDNYIFQGDMVLSLEQIQMILSNTKSAGMHPDFEKYFWKDNIVYYRINEEINENQQIIQAISHWNLKTTLSFIEVPKDFQENFIEFVQWDENYCISALGMHGKKQLIRLRKGAVEKEIIHEIGHAAGLIHEHSRIDRDDWIDVNISNVRTEFRDQFSKCPMKHIMSENFDYTSVMMYPATGYQEDVVYNVDIPTITIKGGNPFYTPHDKLTRGDISLIKKLYPPMDDLRTFTDSRDGNTYKWVKIGDQVWMAENLAYLPEVSPPSQDSHEAPYYYVYGYNGTDVNDAKATDFYSTYGVLYNWPAAMDGSGSSSAKPSGVRGVCPAGWHLPSDAEWKQLEMALGMSQSEADKTGFRGTNQGTQMKATIGWNDNGNGTNTSGFSALPGGFRFTNDGTFINIGYHSRWWSSTEDVISRAWFHSVFYQDEGVLRNNSMKEFGHSVRCVRD